jgi:hypothetical protein
MVSAVGVGIFLRRILFHQYILQPFAAKNIFKRQTLLKKEMLPARH